MNAKILSDFLKTSENSEIIALAKALDDARVKIIEAAKIPESAESANYWRKHKFVADISTDMDFYVNDYETGEISANLVLEWVGDTRECVIAQAKEFLSNPNNYTGSEKNIGYFIKDYVCVGISHICDSEEDFWGTGGNWEIEFQYVSPDEVPPEPKDHKPHTNFFGQRIDLLTEAELIELGFEVNKD